MKRQQALEWLVENVTKWPVNHRFADKFLEGWYWTHAGEIYFASNDGAEIITQQDWLAAQGIL